MAVKTVSFGYFGDKVRAKNIRNVAEQQLNFLLHGMSFQNLQQDERRFITPFGDIIHCVSRFGISTVNIYSPVIAPSPVTLPIMEIPEVTPQPVKIFFKVTFNGQDAEYGGEYVVIKYTDINYGSDTYVYLWIWNDVNRPNSDHKGLTKQYLDMTNVVDGTDITFYIPAIRHDVSSTLSTTVTNYKASLESSLGLTSPPGSVISASYLFKAYENPGSLVGINANDSGLVSPISWECGLNASGYEHYRNYTDYSQTADYMSDVEIDTYTKEELISAVELSTFNVINITDETEQKEQVFSFDAIVPIQKVMIIFSGIDIGMPYTETKVLIAPALLSGYRVGTLDYVDWSGNGNPVNRWQQETVSDYNWSGSGNVYPIWNGTTLDWFSASYDLNEHYEYRWFLYDCTLVEELIINYNITKTYTPYEIEVFY